MPKSPGEVLNVNSHLPFADQLFNKYKTLYNERSKGELSFRLHFWKLQIVLDESSKSNKLHFKDIGKQPSKVRLRKRRNIVQILSFYLGNF